MSNPAKRKDVMAATQDLRRRTLAPIPQPLERLIYLSSTRDYNTGLYRHEGLALRFSEEASCEALADCHRDAFNELVAASLQDLVHQLKRYADNSKASSVNSLARGESWNLTAWQSPPEQIPCQANFCFRTSKLLWLFWRPA